MITFQPQLTTTNKDILKELSIIILVVVVYFFMDLLVTKTAAITSALIVFIVYLISFLIRFGDRRKVKYLTFDEANSLVTFQYKDSLGRTKSKSFPFSNISVQKETSSGWFQKSKNIEIAFVCNGVAEFDLVTEKDGYDKNSLEQIWTTAKDMGLSVKE